MTHSIRTLAVATAVASLVAVAPSVPADANVNKDRVHCVGDYEFNHAPFHASRAQVERYFETTGLGVQIDNGDDGKYIPLWSYRWCGKLPKGVSMRYVQVEFVPGEGSVAYVRATIVD